jgi:hypothetical protein
MIPAKSSEAQVHVPVSIDEKLHLIIVFGSPPALIRKTNYKLFPFFCFDVAYRFLVCLLRSIDLQGFSITSIHTESCGTIEEVLEVDSKV